MFSLYRPVAKDTTMDELDLVGVGLYRNPKRRRGSYEHKNQIEFYKNRRTENDYLSDDSDDDDEGSAKFRKRYRFREKTVEALCLLLGKEIEPQTTTNNAFSAMQKLCIALRFYATGTHQMEVGDGEGASQSSVCRIVKQVTMALSSHASDLIAFHIDQDILNNIQKGFYGFSGSESNFNI